jgi:large subunit ribosomal protein L6
MSRIGKSPVKIPDGVTVTVEANVVSVNGPKGTLSQTLLPGTAITRVDGEVTVGRNSEDSIVRANHGLMRSLLANMVQGTREGFSKKLEINGVGYRVSSVGSDLKFNLGFSHDVNYKVPEGIATNVDQNIITVTGISKQQVGQVAAEIRALKKPEPYKGKGIKYVGERIIRKSGKSGKEKTG